MSTETTSSRNIAIGVIAGILLVAILGFSIWKIKSVNAEKAGQATMIENKKGKKKQ